jgi:hypothetical protein
MLFEYLTGRARCASGMNFIRYDHCQKIEKPNNLKDFGRKEIQTACSKILGSFLNPGHFILCNRKKIGHKP